MISTRGRYALRVMCVLANSEEGKLIPLKEIAAKEEISQKYLEGIMTSLSKADLVACAHGKGGGYGLSKKPEEYSVLEILKITEGSLAPVSCLDGDKGKCGRSECCATLPLWQKLYLLVNDFLKEYTLLDVAKGKIK